jgi:glutathione synthase/RimK-type ligase-like ATP-grasp enzyme
MKLAVYSRPQDWSARWIEACTERGVQVKVVDCTDCDIVAQLSDCDGLLWHVSHLNAADAHFALPLLTSLRTVGKAVFPDPATAWHFDDKLAQKYLLEAVGAPFAKTWVFYAKEDANRFIDRAAYPLVFKLRCGAGSTNVQLVKDRKRARALCIKAFGEGFSANPNYFDGFKGKVSGVASPQDLVGKLKRMPSSIKSNLQLKREMDRERGYLYLQEFLPGATHDTRIAVVGERAWGFRRGVRDADFRASGSGKIDFDPTGIDPRCVEIAFETSRALGCQSMAYDFVKAPNGEQKIVEVCFGYLASAVQACPGYWRPDRSWQEGHFWPQDAIVADLIARMQAERAGADTAGEGQPRLHG